MYRKNKHRHRKQREKAEDNIQITKIGKQQDVLDST